MAKTILIVEDDEFSMKMETDVLKVHGYDVLQSPDGKDTLQLARDHHPDLIIMDIQLPEVSGIDHLKALRADEALKDIPVLAVTAFALKGDKEKILGEGFDDYMAKPISVARLLEMVADHIG